MLMRFPKLRDEYLKTVIKEILFVEDKLFTLKAREIIAFHLSVE